MALVVNTNLQSMQGQRALGQNSQSLQRTFERLSTGLRINRAADDAAGLGVSENLDSDLRSSRQAIRNTNDGISLIQVAEGAANEISNMLKRMKELLVQASSETLGSTERSFISEEVYALRNEIDRVAQTTQWQDTALLTGGASTSGIAVGDVLGGFGTFVHSDGTGFWGGGFADASHPTVAIGTAAVVSGATYGVSSAPAGTFTVDVDLGNNRVRLQDPNGSVTGWTTTMNGGVEHAALQFDNGVELATYFPSGTFTFTELITAIDATPALQTFTTAPMDFRHTVTALNITADPGTYTFSSGGSDDELLILTGPSDSQTIDLRTLGDYTGPNGDGIYNAGSTVTLDYDQLGVSITLDPGTSWSFSRATGALLGGQFGPALSFEVGDSDGIDVQVGASNGQKITIATGSLSAGGLGLDAVSSAAAVDSAGTARGLLSTVDTALNTVGTFRSQLGAQQNRLEAAQRNLTTYTENLSAAKSRIQDADFAYETAQLAKAQILQQSGVAVLGQANRLSQAVTQLLG